MKTASDNVPAMKSTLRLWLLSGFVLLATIGCKERTILIDDLSWSGDGLKVIENHSEYVPTVNLHEGTRMVGQSWKLVTVSLEDHKQAPQERQLLSIPGPDYNHRIASIRGTGLLIHQVGAIGMGSRFMLFDPETAKDVSKSFPFTLFNRSRTAFVASGSTGAAIFDTLSISKGEPTVLAQVPWQSTLERLKYGRVKAVLTEDLSALILLPDLASPSYVTSSNFVIEVFSKNGDLERWSIPLERNWERFVDAESINGEIVILSRVLLPNGAQEEVKLTNMKGETLHTQKISAFTWDAVWNPERHELLFPPSDLWGEQAKQPSTFLRWNYVSNTVESLPLHWRRD